MKFKSVTYFFFLLKYASEQQRAIDTKGHFREGEHFQKAYNVEDDRSIKITVNFNKTLQIGPHERDSTQGVFI